MGEVGIKETLELLEGLKVVGVTGAKVFEDKKINLEDLPKLVELGQNFSVLKDAVEGIKDVDDELKELDQQEIMQIVSKVFELVKAIKEANNDSN